MAAASLASAQPLLAPGDVGLRHDVQLLADAGVISGPVTTWPLFWPEIARSLSQADLAVAERAGVAASLARVRAAAGRAATLGTARSFAAAAASDTETVRSFQGTPREKGEVQLGMRWLGTRTAASLRVAAVVDPDDEKDVRLDGSYAALYIANWVVTAGAIDRWWGPGWESSLILTNNARPIPGLAIERAYSDAPAWRALKWIGPWHASVSMGALEGSSVAVPDARFFAARVSLRPRSWLELGLSRTAQWCGTGRPCDLETFGDLLIGRDNPDAALSVDRQPGNQMAGYDLRMRSPWVAAPVALYAQLIGEDEASGLPSKFLGLGGLEWWGGSRLGSYRLFAELADTTCNFSRSQPQFDCAYRNSLYPQGYTYRGRAIGNSLGGDGRMVSFGAVLRRPGGDSWSLRTRRLELNRSGAVPESTHETSPSRDRINNLELQYNHAFAWGVLGVGLGLDDFAGPLRHGSDVRALVQWRQGY